MNELRLEESASIELNPDGRGARLRIPLSATNVEEIFAHPLLNLRNHGLVVRTHQTLSLGAPVAVELLLGGETLSASGFVVWVQTEAAHRAPAIGIRLSVLRSEDWAALLQLLEAPSAAPPEGARP